MCTVNRASTYVLLSILVNLCAMTYVVAAAVFGGSGRTTNKKTLNFICAVIPTSLCAMGYAMEGESPIFSI